MDHYLTAEVIEATARLFRGLGRVQGEFEFSEDPPGNRIFDHQIAKLKTQIFFCVKKTKIMLG